MNPAWSMIFFTTLAGAAQGLMLALVGIDGAARLGHIAPVSQAFFLAGAVLVLGFSAVGLAASVFHLGRPMRARRAVVQWRTSWLSREVIVLPSFMLVVFLWGVAHWLGAPTLWLGVLAALLALALYLCTGMIYAAVAAIREWASPLTPLNFATMGLASGLTLARALAAFAAGVLAPPLALLALAATVLAALTRAASAWRNAKLAPKTTLQTAIGVRHPQIVQTSQGAMGGSFNTREFFHGKTLSLLKNLRWVVALSAFVLPVLLLAAGRVNASFAVLVIAFALQYLGLLAERWLFFAEGQHAQNLYYQRIG